MSRASITRERGTYVNSPLTSFSTILCIEGHKKDNKSIELLLIPACRRLTTAWQLTFTLMSSVSCAAPPVYGATTEQERRHCTAANKTNQNSGALFFALAE